MINFKSIPRKTASKLYFLSLCNTMDQISRSHIERAKIVDTFRKLSIALMTRHAERGVYLC